MVKRGSGLLAVFCFVMALSWASCRKDSPAPGLFPESLKFAENKVELMVGDIKSVGLVVNPAAVKNNIKVEYTVSGKDVIVIDAAHSGSDGVVFEAAGPGNVVIMAKAAGMVDYCDVKVIGGNEASIPYIALTDSVLEISLGRKKHAVASLQGGAMADYSSFMFSNENDKIVTLDFANNTAVLEGIAPGSSRVTVSHPKAQYAVDIIAFVIAEGQTARYITGENVVFMTLGGSVREYSIRMIGFDENELNYCSYKVVQGSDIVGVRGAGGSCAIEAKNEGVAKVQVSHQGAEYPFEFQVVVNKNNEARYITADRNFFLLSGGAVATVNLSVNADNFDADSNYHWTVDSEDIIGVNNINNTLIVKALNNGTAKVTVTNKYSDYPCEILFVVHQSVVMEGEEKFIRASQQVIQMEKDGPDARLILELVGGTQADHNSFEWVVEDSSIITVQAPGHVNHRAMAVVSSAVEALITAHKAGTTRVIVSNPAAGVQNDVSVLVKVYPYGTFYGKAVSLSGPGIIKVQTGDKKEIYTPVVGGNANLMGAVVWSSGNVETAKVDGSGLHGVVSGVKQGITQIRVDGDGVVNPYEGVIMVYNPGQEEYIPYIYADHLRYDVPTGATQRIAIYHPNTEDKDFMLKVDQTEAGKRNIFLVKQNNIILVNGVEVGTCKLTVYDENNPDCNSLVLTINVVDNEVDVDHPYSLSGDNFFGIGLDESDKTYTVAMAGAERGELNKLIYTIDDSGIAQIARSSENQVVLRGVKTGQTTLRVNHSKSVNEKTVVVFVVAKATDVKDTVIIGIEKPNYVMYPTQSIFLRLITNATEAQKKTFTWKRDSDMVAGYDTNYDTAMVTALKAGSARITVSTAGNIHLMDLDIFITVTEYNSLRPELGYPDSVALVKGQSKVIRGSAVNTAPGQTGAIQYSLEDSSVARITPNGLDVTIQGDEKGQTYLNVSCANLGFVKKILVICVNSEAELENLYYFTAEKPLYRIKKGEQTDIKLKLGGDKFEQYNQYIKWENTVSGGAVEIAPKGSSATVLGRNVGVAVIKASHDQALIPVFITVEVTETVKGSDFYWFMYDPIHQMSKHTAGFVDVSVYYGNVYYQDEAGGVTHGQPLAGLYDFTVTSDNPAAATAGFSGAQLRIMAGDPGSTVITLSHPLVRDDARIMVVVYDGDAPEEPGFILFAPKTHYLIEQGKTTQITLNANRPQAPAGLYWHNHSPDIVAFEPETDNYKRAVKAVQAGSAVITLELPMGNVLETVYVGVSSEGDSAEVQAATESIVVLSMNDFNYTTRVIVSGAGAGNIYWQVKDETVVEAVGNGSFAYLYPLAPGMTELTVTGPGFRRVIIVKVVQTDEERLPVKLINIDQRSFKLKKGQKMTVQPYFKIAQPVSAAQAIPSFDNSVIQTRINGKSIEVTAKNIGIERLKVRNNDCENKEIELEFEVSDYVEGFVGESRKLVYMMTQTPFIRLEPGFKDCYVRLSVIGEYQGAQKDFIWSSDNANVTVNAFGDSALVSAGKAHTTSVITVTNSKYCAEPLYITVVVGPQVVYESMTEPYIQADKTVYTAPVGGSPLSIPLDIHNVGAVNWMALQYYGEKQFVHIAQAAGSLKVEPLAVGTDVIHVNYPGVKRELLIYVVVTQSGENSAVYLTTAQNYIIINQNNTRTVDINTVGFVEPDASKIRWNSLDPAVCYVVGNGRTVQAVGLKPGVTKITAEHLGSPKAYNVLDIVVKVLPPGSDEQVCYLTTGDNVIETYIGTQSSQITINKIGGKVPAVDAVWTVDDPTIVGVVGVNNIGYYTPKKAGVAKVTVADREAGALSIVIIVRKSRPGSQYLYTAEPVVLINPGTGGRTLSVALEGGEESDEKDFRWQIYGQLPGDPEIAKQGGSVIMLYGQGARASVSGIYAGTARIKVTHPKAAEALFIVVRVSHESSLRFGQSSVDIVVGELSCVTLRVPEWENYTDKIKYSTKNPGVCTVLGTHRAAVLTGVNVGTTEVTAKVEGTDMAAVINVNIIPRQTYNEPQIVVSKTMYVFSPREAPVMLSARLAGVNVVETDNDLLEWNVINNKNMLKIFPETGSPSHSKGREIQIEVINRNYPVSEICTIEITCPSLKLSENNKRTIVITVQEDTNALRLSKTNINMESGDMVEVYCTIMGGTSKDYDEVIWEAERDSYDKTKDIVKVMGKGQYVQILGVADGVIKLTATFHTLTRDCRVEVKSGKYFNIMYQTFGCYPGQRVEEPGYIGLPYIKYEVRPVTAYIDWMYIENDLNTKSINYSIEPAVDVNGTGVGKITIDPLNEGTCAIMGVSGSKPGKVNIIVKNEYMFRVGTQFIYTSPWEFPCDYDGNPQDAKSKENLCTVEYIMAPGSTAKIRIKAPDTEQSLYNRGLEVKVGSAVASPSSGIRGTGEIRFKALKEFPAEGIPVTFELIRPDGKSANMDKIITVYSRYPLNQARLVPVFENIDAPAAINSTGNDYNAGKAGDTKENNRQAAYAHSLTNGPTGMMYHSGKHLRQESPSWGSDNDGVKSSVINDTYSIDVSDGEEYYILLDKVNIDAMAAIGAITASNGAIGDDIVILPKSGNTVINNAPFGGNSKRGLTVEKITLQDGNIALRVSGGKDFVAFTHFGSDYKLRVGVESGRPNNKTPPVGIIFWKYLKDNPGYVVLSYDHTSVQQTQGTNSFYTMHYKSSQSVYYMQFSLGIDYSIYHDYVTHSETILSGPPPPYSPSYHWGNFIIPRGKYYNDIFGNLIKANNDIYIYCGEYNSNYYINNFILYEYQTNYGSAAETWWDLTGEGEVPDAVSPSRFGKQNVNNANYAIQIEKQHYLKNGNEDFCVMIFNPKDKGTDNYWKPRGESADEKYPANTRTTRYNSMMFYAKENRGYLVNFITGKLYKWNGSALNSPASCLDFASSQNLAGYFNGTAAGSDSAARTGYTRIPSNYTIKEYTSIDATKSDDEGRHAFFDIKKGQYVSGKWTQPVRAMNDFPYAITAKGGAASKEEDILAYLIDPLKEKTDNSGGAVYDRYAEPDGGAQYVYYPAFENRRDNVLQSKYQSYTITIPYTSSNGSAHSLKIILNYSIYQDHYKRISPDTLKYTWDDTTAYPAGNFNKEYFNFDSLPPDNRPERLGKIRALKDYLK